MEGIQYYQTLLDLDSMACFDGSNQQARLLCLQALQVAKRFVAIDIQADILATLGGLSSQTPQDALKLLTDAVQLSESRDLL